MKVQGTRGQNLKIGIKNLLTYFVSYLEKEISCDIEILSSERVLNKEYFYGKIVQKVCNKSQFQTPF